ncbi:MAG TPA: nucleotidyltransferase domain-containing protein [Candidatus Saccharimonadales bacterium]|nr:nucleotidyltransferase domain-containing protein [Candidatus Saccharimonadales bacterium]
MHSPDTYSLDTIHGFLQQEHPDLHGVSPAVFAQNKLISKLTAVGAEFAGPGILGVGLLGSRAHGTAQLDSDVDIATLRYDDSVEEASRLHTMLRHALRPLGIDTGLAAAARGVSVSIPSEPEKFIQWVTDLPSTTIGLFERGVYATSNLRLGAFAAIRVIQYRTSDPLAVWGIMRRCHAEAYLGNRGRMAKKLQERLALGSLSLQDIIPSDLMEKRVNKFGLPEHFVDYYRQVTSWFQSNQQHLTRERGYDLYQGVLERVRRP